MASVHRSRDCGWTLIGSKVMQANTHILISAEHNINVGNWSLSGDGWSVIKYSLHGGFQEGVELIEIDNGVLVITIIPTRGMNVMSVRSKNITLGWDSPVKEIVHPRNVNLTINNGLGWLDSFNEWMVRGGIEYSGHPGDDNGRLLTLHGRIAHIPASEVSVTISGDSRQQITLKGVVRESSFKSVQFVMETKLTTDVGSMTFRFDDKVTNKASNEKEFQILYHANFAKQLLEEGSRLHGTVDEIQPFNDYAAMTLKSWNVYAAPAEEWVDEKIYQIKPFADSEGRAHFLLQNAAGDKAVSFNYNLDNLPYFSQWKNEDSIANGYVTGLEPGNTFPANRAHERKKGRIPKLKGGESAEYHLVYTLHDTKSDVNSAISKIDKLNAGKRITYVEQPEKK